MEETRCVFDKNQGIILQTTPCSLELLCQENFHKHYQVWEVAKFTYATKSTNCW